MSQHPSKAQMAPATGALTHGPLAAPRTGPGLLLRAYRGLMTAAVPTFAPFLALRERRGKETRARRRERFGFAGRPRPEGPLLWVHAASVGETNAVLPLIAAITERDVGLQVLLTTVTVTSARLAAERLHDGAVHQFLPLDSLVFVRRFLDHWRPDLALFVESEVWPNFVLELAARSIPLALVNGRLSERSYERWRRWPSFSRPLFGRFDLVLAQNEATAQRFLNLGAPHVRAAGSLKMDAPPPPVDDAELRRLIGLTRGRPIFLAASTHAGENGIVIEAHEALRARYPGLLTIVAPRHPQRGPELAERAAARGLGTALRSRGGSPERECEIYVADTIGELGLLYALSPVAFIGGSMVARGGQNPAEAIQLDAAILTGPHVRNFADAYAALATEGGCRIVGSGTELVDCASALLADKDACAEMQARARAVLNRMNGALGRTLAALEAHLPRRPGIRRAS